MNGLALCAGVGGIELGLRLALGRRYQTVGYVERDAFAASCLVARMEDETLDPAPVWDDLETFDGVPWRGVVDLISSGFPCQPFSVAGDRRGTDDDRWVWPSVARIIAEVEPSLLFLENVPGILARHGGMGDVLGDLATLGFDAKWCCLSAVECGAPHIRDRVWILAHAQPSELRQQPGRRSRQNGAGSSIPRDDGGEPMQGREYDGKPRGHADRRVQAAVADASSSGLAQREGGAGSREARATALSSRSTDGGRGWWATEPDVGRVADGVASRVDRLRAIGNGVVPVVAARAFLELRERLI